MPAPVLAFSETAILTKIPAGATSGPITVTSASGTVSSAQPFTVLPKSTPLVASIGPGSGPTAGGGLAVSITGAGFQAGATVAFGGTTARAKYWSDTFLTASAPYSPSAGAVDVTVTNPDGGSATRTGAYAYAAGTSITGLIVPVVLDVVSNAGSTPAHFTTEITLTNGGATAANLTFRYYASAGTGNSSAFDTIGAGKQFVVPDMIAYLRGKGIAIPTTGIGTLQIVLDGVSNVQLVAATARTTTATVAPQPVGAAGLAYTALHPFDRLFTSDTTTIYGLRQNDSDRSNVAIFNPGTRIGYEALTVKATAFSGDGSGASTVVNSGTILGEGSWTQFSGILGGPGYATGWVTLEITDRESPLASFSAYGVINDQVTNDGSYVVPSAGFVNPLLLPAITLPVIVETPAFQSEMVVANRSGNAVTFLLGYTESATPSDGSVKGSVPLTLQPYQQLIIPGAVDLFRQFGVPIGAQGQATYVGTVRALVLGTTLDQVFLGARTASPSPAGGQFGLFTPGVYAGEEASTSAFVFGLLSDANNRSNVAVLNAGQDADGSVTLSVQAYDGDAGGSAAGTAETITLIPGQWHQYGNFLTTKGIANGWVKVTRTSGTAPWIAYGVINDGGQPGQRTGDGAYVAMER